MDFRDLESNDIEGAAFLDRENSFPDDDDRAYNASVEMDESPGWYPEWKGPDTGAMEDWNEFLRANGDSMTPIDDPDFLPEFDPNDLPF